MKKLVTLLAILCLLPLVSFAESPESAEDYVLSQGFTIADVDEYDGSPKCYMLEDLGWQSVAFTTTDKIYGIISLEEFDANFNPEKLRLLFYDLAQRFDWDVIFYWPNRDTDDQISVSFGITQDLDKTKLNYSNKSEFLETLDLQLFESQPVNDQVDSVNAAIDAYKESIYKNLGFERNSITAFLEDKFGLPVYASEFSPLSTKVCAEYALFNDFAACRTGVGSENMLLYAYSSVDNPKSISDDELWACFSSLKAYISENKASIVGDGAIAGADTMCVVIDIVTSDSYDRAVYDLITDECTIKSMN